MRREYMSAHGRFQSTLPVWGATNQYPDDDPGQRISIHAPRVGSDIYNAFYARMRNYFNPRSPCGERQYWNAFLIPLRLFQSTLPVWGATSDFETEERVYKFQSTLPVWGATQFCTTANSAMAFQSTLPVWGATIMQQTALMRFGFQSTLPVWGATLQYNAVVHLAFISIHAPRVGSDDGS